MNIRGSDGTIIFGTINSPGSRLTWDLCSRFKKSCMHLEVPFTFIKRVEYFRDWIMRNNIKVLNVAGNRESVNPGICEAVTSFLMEALIEVSHG